MDLTHALLVLWKRKWLLGLGFFAGVVLAGLSLYKIHVDLPTRSWSYEPQSYTTYETSIELLLDEPGFAYGNLRSDLRPVVVLAQSFPALIMSEIVQEKIKRKLGSIQGSMIASAPEGTPLVNITVEGRDPRHIQKLAETAADVFIGYIRAEQKANKTPLEDRVTIRKLGPPSLPQAQQSRKWEIALLVFLSLLMSTAALAFVMENLEQTRLGLREQS